MLSEQIELITKFLNENKQVIKVHGFEREAGVYKHFWAKYCCGATDPLKAEQKNLKPHIEKSFQTLQQLRNDIDKVLAQY